MVTAGRDEERIRHPRHHLEPEDPDVEVVHALDVGRAQVHMADVDARIDRTRFAHGRILARTDALG